MKQPLTTEQEETARRLVEPGRCPTLDEIASLLLLCGASIAVLLMFFAGVVAALWEFFHR